MNERETDRQSTKHSTKRPPTSPVRRSISTVPPSPLPQTAQTLPPYLSTQPAHPRVSRLWFALPHARLTRKAQEPRSQTQSDPTAIPDLSTWVSTPMRLRRLTNGGVEQVWFWVDHTVCSGDLHSFCYAGYGWSREDKYDCIDNAVCYLN